MAKKEIRVITASEDVVGIIDHGADVDTQLKNLTYEDRAIKVRIAQAVEGVFQEGETSVRLKGGFSAVMVTASEKVELDAGAESFPEVRKAIDAGLLEGFVERKLSLVVPPADVERAAEVLRQAGIMAAAAETLSVEAESLRGRETSSMEQALAVKALRACSSSEVTYRVKYEKV